MATVASMLHTRWLLVTLAPLLLACGSKSTPFTTPSCDAPQQCVYTQQNDAVCRQSCFEDAGSCPSGEVCSGASACCTNTPAAECSSPSARVCCPASGC
jgi:hypothetical protein